MPFADGAVAESVAEQTEQLNVQENGAAPGVKPKKEKAPKQPKVPKEKKPQGKAQGEFPLQHSTT